MTVVGYGASVGVTTLLYYFDIGELLRFLVDDNVAKQNLFSPGLHLPVFHSSILYDKMPDYVLILSWRYADQIIENHKSYRSSGGHFIRFLPTLQVI